MSVARRGIQRPGSVHLILALVPLVLVACESSGAGTPAGPSPTAGQSQAGCRYLFRATVQSGPSVQYSPQGKLVLVQGGAGKTNGMLLIDGRDSAFGTMSAIPAEVVVSGNSITITLKLDNGPMQATGSIKAPIAECSESLQGTTTGPNVGDAGVWQAVADPTNKGGPEFDNSLHDYNTCVRTCTNAKGSPDFCAFACQQP